MIDAEVRADWYGCSTAIPGNGSAQVILLPGRLGSPAPVRQRS